jgi:hypothetical protein
MRWSALAEVRQLVLPVCRTPNWWMQAPWHPVHPVNPAQNSVSKFAIAQSNQASLALS